MRWAMFACLALACCRHQVQPLNKGAISQTDAFPIGCAAKRNCDGGVPLRVFVTSRAPSTEITVTRNGLVLYGGAENFDYSVAPAHDGLLAVTLTAQPVADGDLITLRYLTAASR